MELLGEIFPGYNMTLSAQLPAEFTDELRSELERHRVPHPLFNDVLGLVEQLVCAGGFDFVGTTWSTFSEHITKMRAKERRDHLLPEFSGAWPRAVSSWPHNYPRSASFC